jgi:iron complex outermembrane receptor protein
MQTQVKQSARSSAQRFLAGVSLGAVLAAIAMPAFAQSAASEVDQVIVTGTRGVQRTVIDSPTPIDVVTTQDLQRGARTDLMQQLNEVIPSFNVPARGANGTGFVVQTGGLRGVNVDHTLVLVNGKRRHRSAHINVRGFNNAGSQPVDFSAIPGSAVARIEVLRDGASAQYGSDAIAGVINVITKHTGTEGRLTASYGANMDEGDGRQYKIDGFKGFALPHDGSLILSFDARQQTISNRAVPVGPEQQLYFPVNGAPDPREATADRLLELNYGQNPSKSVSGAFDFTLPLTGETEIYAYGMGLQRNNTLIWNRRRANTNNSLPEIYPNGFNPRTKVAERDWDGAAGIRSVISGWDVDLGTTLGVNRYSYHGYNTLNVSLGPTSPTSFYYGKQKEWDWNNSFDITKGYEVGGGNLQVSLGLLHRREQYIIGSGDPRAIVDGGYRFPAGRPNAGQRALSGAQAQTTFLPQEASNTKRNNFAGYIDLGFDVTDKWFVGAALRQEHFDDSAGDSTIYKLTTRYEVTDGLAFRAAVNTGFKAPTLGQSAYGSTNSTLQTVNAQQVINLVKFLPVNSPAAKALGSEPLTPEKSFSISGGVTAQPFSGLTLTLDGYRIDIDKRIALTELLQGAPVLAILRANGITEQIDSAQYFTNAIDTRTKGFDFVATYRWSGDYGSFSHTFSYNYNVSKITGVIANPPELAVLPGVVLFGRSNQNGLLRSPKDKANFTNNWRMDKLSVTVQFNRYGKYTQVATLAADDRVVKPKIITNLDVTYDLTDNVRVSLGANNLFNTYPARINAPGLTTGTGMYPGGTGYGMTGGSYYGRLSFGF